MNPPCSSVHRHLFPYPPCVHSPRPVQLALVLVGSSGEQVACGGQGDSNRPPVPNHVRVARGAASWRDGAQDTPSSLYGDSVGVGWRETHPFRGKGLSHGAALFVAIDDMSGELKELL